MKRALDDPIRIVVFGAGGSGKSCLLQRIAHKSYNDDYMPTEQASRRVCILQCPQSQMRDSFVHPPHFPKLIEIIELPREEFSDTWKGYFHACEGLVVVMSPCNRLHLNFLWKHLPLEIAQKRPIMIVTTMEDQYASPLYGWEQQQYNAHTHNIQPVGLDLYALTLPNYQLLQHVIDASVFDLPTSTTTTTSDSSTLLTLERERKIASLLIEVTPSIFDQTSLYHHLPIPLIQVCLLYLYHIPTLYPIEVPWDEINHISNEWHAPVMRTSAKTGRGVNEAFWRMACMIDNTPWSQPPFDWIPPITTNTKPAPTPPSLQNDQKRNKCVLM